MRIQKGFLSCVITYTFGINRHERT